MPDNIKENQVDFSHHRALISHAMKGEPAQMAPIFAGIMSDKITAHIETRRAEIGVNLFSGTDED